MRSYLKVQWGAFAVAFGGYLYLHSASSWIRPLHHIATALIMAAALALVLVSIRAQNWLAAKLYALFFVGMHVREWIFLHKQGIGLAHAPWGNSLFGLTYYGLTSFTLLGAIVGMFLLFKENSKTEAQMLWKHTAALWVFLIPTLYFWNIGNIGWF
jgi:heme/copper-type cytochrome/quinol oxidase subunit 3